MRGADAGEFFARTDSLEGGKSNIVWPVEIPYSDGRDFFTQVKDACRGICGVAHFGQGESSDAPFVEIGFNVEGRDSSGKYYAMDVSNWKGICAQYYSGVPIALTLDLGDSVNRDLGMDLPFVTLPKADSVSNFVCFEWKDFKQSGSGKLSASYKYGITGENAAKQLVKVIFKMQGTSGSESSFRIMAISSKRPNSTDWGEETKSSSSSAVAMLPIFCKAEAEDNCEYGTQTYLHYLGLEIIHHGVNLSCHDGGWHVVELLNTQRGLYGDAGNGRHGIAAQFGYRLDVRLHTRTCCRVTTCYRQYRLHALNLRLQRNTFFLKRQRKVPILTNESSFCINS